MIGVSRGLVWLCRRRKWRQKRESVWARETTHCPLSTASQRKRITSSPPPYQKRYERFLSKMFFMWLLEPSRTSPTVHTLCMQHWMNDYYCVLQPSMDPSEALDLLSNDFTDSSSAPTVQTSPPAPPKQVPILTSALLICCHVSVLTATEYFNVVGVYQN